MKTFGGPVLFLDRSDINTDEIIPAKYLTEITKEDLQPYILEDLKHPICPGDSQPCQFRLRFFAGTCAVGI